MVAIGRPSPARLALLDRAAGDLPALLLVLTPIALLNVLVGTRPAGAPGPAEADAVVGASGARRGRVARTSGSSASCPSLQAVAGAAWDSSLLQSARGICLLAGLVSAALLWPVLRRLGLGGNAAATAVIVAGLGPLALRLQPSVDPGAVAAAWIGLAAAVGFRVRLGSGRRVVVLAASGGGRGHQPVAAAGLLAAAAHALAGRTPVARICRRGAAAPRLAAGGPSRSRCSRPWSPPRRCSRRRPAAGPRARCRCSACSSCSGWPRWSWAGPGSTGRRCAWWSIDGRGLAGLRPGARPGPAHRPAAGRAGAGAAGRGAARERRHRPQPAALHRRRDGRDGGPGQRHGDRAVAGGTAAAQLVRAAGPLADPRSWSRTWCSRPRRWTGPSWSPRACRPGGSPPSRCRTARSPWCRPRPAAARSARRWRGWPRPPAR